MYTQEQFDKDAIVAAGPSLRLFLFFPMFRNTITEGYAYCMSALVELIHEDRFDMRDSEHRAYVLEICDVQFLKSRGIVCWFYKRLQARSHRVIQEIIRHTGFEGSISEFLTERARLDEDEALW